VRCFSESFLVFGFVIRCSEAELIYFSHQENRVGKWVLEIEKVLTFIPYGNQNMPNWLPVDSKSLKKSKGFQMYCPASLSIQRQYVVVLYLVLWSYLEKVSACCIQGDNSYHDNVRCFRWWCMFVQWLRRSPKNCCEGYHQEQEGERASVELTNDPLVTDISAISTKDSKAIDMP